MFLFVHHQERLTLIGTGAHNRDPNCFDRGVIVGLSLDTMLLLYFESGRKINGLAFSFVIFECGHL